MYILFFKAIYQIFKLYSLYGNSNYSFLYRGTKINEVVQILAETKGIAEVFSVSGQYDLVALARVAKNEDLADLMTDRIRSIEGIMRSETLIAFRSLSKYDLSALFDLGS